MTTRSATRTRTLAWPAVFASLAGCMRVPVMPSAHSLMRGQDESAYTLQASKYSADTTSATPGTALVSESKWNIVFGGDHRYGLPLRGLEAGISLDTGLNLAGDLKYQLWIPADPRTPVVALDAAAGANLLGPELGAAVLASRPLGRAELTGAARFTLQHFGFVGRALDPDPRDSYGYNPGAGSAGFLDLGATLNWDRPFNRIVLGLNLRLPVAGGSASPGIDSTDFGPAITFSLSWRSKQYVPYAGSHYAAPRKHVMAYTPYGRYSAREHMDLGRRLFRAGMFLDARDEFNAALLTEPKTTEAYRWIAQCFEELKEPELAYANYCQALRYDPRDDELKQKVKAGRARAGRNR